MNIRLTPITPDGYKKLKIHLKHLKTIELPGAIKAISIAREHGDLSENAEYNAAKESYELIEKRIKDIQAKLSNVRIINTNQNNVLINKVVFGSKVKIICLENEKEEEICIVGEYESDWTKGKISINSPIAKGLMGKSIKDEIKIMIPKGVKTYKILYIRS